MSISLVALTLLIGVPGLLAIQTPAWKCARLA